MSNTITNILTINGTEEQVAEVRNFIKGSNGESISFQSFFPVPKNLKGKRNVNVKIGSETVSIPDWMECRLRYWGTTSEAIPIDDDAINATNRIIFNTATTPPVQAISMLSLEFPEVSFNIIFSDENAGEFSGEFTFKDEELIERTFLSDDSDEAMEYYFLTHEYDRAKWKKNEDGEWRYIYDEDQDEE